ncbi:hypothetical protein [Lyngbya sp. CCY1209]|uniref:hypothetical protein n=1 Tax=Lyngbya sp. CCY1209 TaxID=2886103 RepID=UPI002D20001C|nr:hypothetical protein [Lyngbya sp. CCY1209]MEB3884092.1 hypothetical protein [Lyngbya sp. CCY1209]
MTTFNRLHPWCLVRSPDRLEGESASPSPAPVVARFRSCNDAIEHGRVLRRLIPGVRYRVVYDPPDKGGASASEQV